MLKSLSLQDQKTEEEKANNDQTNKALIQLDKLAIEESIEEINPSGLKDLLLEIPKVFNKIRMHILVYIGFLVRYWRIWTR